MNESDHILVQQALRGNLCSFDVLVRRYQGAVFGVAYHWTHSYDEAQDIAQETFFTAFRDALDLPLSTIKMRLHRAKNTLREKEAVDMAEKYFGKRDTAEVELDLQFKQGAGFFHSVKEGWGFLRPSFDADNAPDDLYVSPSQRRMLNLIQGDYLHVTARPPKGEERYWAVVRMEQINFRSLVVPVSGYLHCNERGFGFLRPDKGAPTAESDVYVSPQQVRDLDLKEGDFVEGVTFSRRQSRLAVNRVNHQPMREPVSPETLEVDGEFLRSGSGEQVVEQAREQAERLRHTYIGSEHLLLGLLQQPEGRAIKVLYELGIHPRTLSAAVWQYSPPSGEEQEPVDEALRPFTPRARQLCATAMVEAEEMAFEPVDAEHLLLALARDEAGVAGQTLLAFGANYTVVRKVLKGLLTA